MVTEARIVEDWEYGGIGIFIARGDAIFGRNYRTGDPQTRLRSMEQAPDPEFGPLVRLTDPEARAVLEALVRHFNGAEDTRALRKDYDAERARVDRFIEHLTKPPILLGEK